MQPLKTQVKKKEKNQGDKNQEGYKTKKETKIKNEKQIKEKKNCTAISWGKKKMICYGLIWSKIVQIFT